MPDLRGRRGTPTELKLVAGNPGKRALPKHEPQPPKGEPPMTKRVRGDTIARGKWRELVELTTGMGVLTIADGPMLELACLSYSRWLTAENAGYWNRAAKHERDYERRLCHFGLSPAVRSKVSQRPDAKPSAAAKHFK